MAVFEMQNAKKAFGLLEVLKGVSLKVEKGEVVSIIGPSGGGKSTMLRCATLLETMDSGTLAYGENVAAREENGKGVYAGKAALAQVPQDWREASLALGASPFETIMKVILPNALPGILTGSILALSRAAGETAAIMYTGSVFFTPKESASLFEPVMALPYHIYVLATSGTNIEATRPLQYGTALVLLLLVLCMSSAAIWLRERRRG